MEPADPNPAAPSKFDAFRDLLEPWAGSRVLVADDDEAFVGTVARGLMRYGIVVTRTYTLAQTRAALDGAQPDVALVDLRFGDGVATRLIKELAAKLECGVVVITGSDAYPDIRAGLSAGAGWVLAKPPSMAAIFAAVSSEMIRIRHVRGRLARASATVPDRALSSLRALIERSADLYGLRGRVRETYLMAMDGSTYDQIAERLEISQRTVREHMRSAREAAGGKTTWTLRREIQGEAAGERETVPASGPTYEPGE